MTPDQVLETYDEEYVRRYEESFLFTPDHGFLDKTRLELMTLRLLTLGAESWLDVACGTGYFLRNARGHEALRCAGLDLSPAMVAAARRANPDALILQGSFLDEHPQLEGRWDVVSSLWGAYGLQASFEHIARLVENLARWTSPGGTVLMPLFDPQLFLMYSERGQLAPGIFLSEDGTRWSFHEPDGKQHQDMLAPPIASMRALFEPWFESVSTFPYPEPMPMVGLLAQGRRRGARADI